MLRCSGSYTVIKCCRFWSESLKQQGNVRVKIIRVCFLVSTSSALGNPITKLPHQLHEFYLHTQLFPRQTPGLCLNRPSVPSRQPSQILSLSFFFCSAPVFHEMKIFLHDSHGVFVVGDVEKAFCCSFLHVKGLTEWTLQKQCHARHCCRLNTPP